MSFIQLIEKFTSFISRGDDMQETSSKVGYNNKYNNIEIPPFTLDGYCTTKPINIHIEYLNNDEYIAVFEEAGISFSASTATEAIQELKIEIIEVYKCYNTENCLGDWPAHQLTVLGNYIA